MELENVDYSSLNHSDLPESLSDSTIELIRSHLEKLQSVENPFSHKTKSNCFEMFKVGIGIVFLPIKLVVITVCLLILWLVCEIVTSCGYDYSKPMSFPRRILLSMIGYPMIRLILLCSGVLWVSTKGKRAKFSEAPIVAAVPHSTSLDALLSIRFLGPPSGFGKLELVDIPIIGTIIKTAQIILVDRSSHEAKEKALQELVRRCTTTEEDWSHRSFLVFPEGTCTNRKSLIQFKRGAFTPGVPVQLMVFKWSKKGFNPTWTSRIKVEVEFSPVYVPSEEEKQDPMLYAANVREVAAQMLNAPKTEHSYDDSVLSKTAKKENFNPETVIDFEFEKLNDLTHIDIAQAIRLLKQFGVDEVVKKRGKMNVEQFANSLESLTVTEVIRDIFNAVDKDCTGLIDFKSYVIGLFCVYNHSGGV